MIGNVNHNMIFCSFLQGYGKKLINLVGGESLDKNDTSIALVLLFEDPINDPLPVIWCLATMWSNFWSCYLGKRNVETYAVRADLEAKIRLLRTTRKHQNIIDYAEFLLNNS